MKKLYLIALITGLSLGQNVLSSDSQEEPICSTFKKQIIDKAFKACSGKVFDSSMVCRYRTNDTFRQCVDNRIKDSYKDLKIMLKKINFK